MRHEDVRGYDLWDNGYDGWIQTGDGRVGTVRQGTSYSDRSGSNESGEHDNGDSLSDNRQPVKYGSGHSDRIGENGEIIEKSRKALQETADDTVTQESASKPKQKVKTTLQKQLANYNSDKVYSNKDVVSTFNEVSVFQRI